MISLTSGSRFTARRSISSTRRQSPFTCFGCASAETTLLVPLPVIRDILDSISMTKTEDRDYWHIVIQKKQGKFIIRLLGAKDGPDLTTYNIGVAAKATVVP